HPARDGLPATVADVHPAAVSLRPGRPRRSIPLDGAIPGRARLGPSNADMRIAAGLAERIDYQVPVLLPARLPRANALSPRHNVSHVIRPHVRAQIEPSLIPRPGDESATPRATLHIRLHLGPNLRAITGLLAVTDLAAGNIHHARANRLRSHYSPSKK